jgi:hypothetical protein
MPQSELTSIIYEIRAAHRQRMFGMETRKGMDQALGDYLRMTLGWSLSLPQDHRDEINDKALGMIAECEVFHRKQLRYLNSQNKISQQILDAVQQGKLDHKRLLRLKENLAFPESPTLEETNVILSSIQARSPFDKIEADSTRRLKELAALLPVYPWVNEPDQRGFGPLSLAIIVAEAGTDLLDYPNPAKLWSRMGLGLFDDGHGTLVRQGGLPKTASKETWIKHKYSPRRRSRIWTIGKALVNGNHEGLGDDKRDLRWRRIYVTRKAYERDRAEAAGLIVAPAGSIPKRRTDEYMSIGHIDRRAQRYMEKALLKEIWIKWQRAGTAYWLTPNPGLSHSAAA